MAPQRSFDRSAAPGPRSRARRSDRARAAARARQRSSTGGGTARVLARILCWVVGWMWLVEHRHGECGTEDGRGMPGRAADRLATTSGWYPGLSALRAPDLNRSEGAPPSPSYNATMRRSRWPFRACGTVGGCVCRSAVALATRRAVAAVGGLALILLHGGRGRAPAGCSGDMACASGCTQARAGHAAARRTQRGRRLAGAGAAAAAGRRAPLRRRSYDGGDRRPAASTAPARAAKSLRALHAGAPARWPRPRQLSALPWYRRRRRLRRPLRAWYGRRGPTARPGPAALALQALAEALAGRADAAAAARGRRTLAAAAGQPEPRCAGSATRR